MAFEVIADGADRVAEAGGVVEFPVAMISLVRNSGRSGSSHARVNMSAGPISQFSTNEPMSRRRSPVSESMRS